MTHPHSPLPWTVSDLYFGDELVSCANIVDADGLRIVRAVDRNHAALIVTAVNNYEKMRKALEELAEAEQAYRTAHDQFGDGDMRAGRAWDRMRRAGDTARAALCGGVR